ncbi:branched-chain amino acid transport system substrate-binding protein [Monoraphidium neglectum]|uniref:Branched-chain amino acid transport system substrate-binding protein n=1 Tax=Monoraphidium neglectum TaxID=145388 RepID=A0A0D2MCJ8_9CHLO|nr:branched-chain amino acid transport system substrate-binding protein [Monoraphidium neglectum]KIY92990.1 branched-chain amino acid transport system substrate-binding protein [Monoraphidium neglectum]|eukprot:XP_013892010.1 branched-chain amino acid transport system substrate-binding protein [Monoraphidium neglectum]
MTCQRGMRGASLLLALGLAAALLALPHAAAQPAAASPAPKAAPAAAKASPAPLAKPAASPAPAAASTSPAPAAAKSPTVFLPAAKPAASPAAAASSAPAAAAPTAGKKTLKIGCLVPLTGGKTNTGRAVQAAIEMAIRDVAPKRLPGVDVQLVCEDTKCADVPSLRAAQRLARDKGVNVLIGDVCSAASLAATSVANKYQLPMVSPASTSVSLSTAGDYFFRTVPSDRYQGQFAAAKMGALGLKKVVVAFSDESYGQGLSFAFIAAFTKDGGRAFPVPLPAGVRNTSAVLAEIRRNQADGVFIASNNVLQGAATALQAPLVLSIRQSFGSAILARLLTPSTCLTRT